MFHLLTAGGIGGKGQMSHSGVMAGGIGLVSHSRATSGDVGWCHFQG